MKYIVVDSVKDGNRYLRKENKKNHVVISNTKCVSLMEFAKEVVVRQQAKKGILNALDILDGTSSAVLLLEMLKEKADDSYFVPKESISQETAQEVCSILTQLRMGAVTDMFESSDATHVIQLKELLHQYEAFLVEKDQYDKARIYKDAISILRSNATIRKQEQDTIVITDVYKNHLSAVELVFLDLYTNGNYEVFSLKDELSLNDALAGMEFFESYGMANEVQYVISKMMEKEYPFGDVEIFYTSAEYEPYIEAAFDSRGIPYAMIHRQMPADNAYLHMMKYILKWASDNYSYESLKPIMMLAGKYRNTFYREIRAGIGWGMERYESYIKAERQKKPVDEAAQNRQEKTLAFCDCLEQLLHVFKWKDTKEVSYLEVYWKLVDVTRMLLENREDYKYVSEKLKSFSRTVKCLGRGKNIEDVIYVLSREIKALTYDDMEMTNAVCIRKLDSDLHILERKHIFVLGMSSKHFGSVVIESPVLSDQELETFLDSTKGYVRLAKREEEKKVESLYQTISTRDQNGTLTIGYSSYDTVNLRNMSPSIPYIRMLQQSGLDRTSIQKCGYENLILGNIFYEEDALWDTVEIEEKEVIGMPIASWSTTSLQELLSCPLQFYYHRVLRLPDESYKQAQSDRWLPANDKGTLAHGIMEDYCNQEFLNKKSQEVSSNLQEAFFDQVVDHWVKKMLEVCPYVSKAAYEAEVEQVKTNCKNYLEKMHAEFSDPSNKWMVVACEKDFADIEIAFASEEGTINLPFRGQMDRLDRYVDEEGIAHYRIMDYKSGRRKKHEDEISDNRSVQHVVYKLALEAMHENESILVDQVTFIHFFEDKMEDQELTLLGASIQDFPQEVHEVVVHVIQNAEYQKRITGEGQKDKRNKACDYCTYKDICKEYIGEKL